MYIDKDVCEREIIKIINSSNEITELRGRIEQYWDKTLKSAYGDNVHNLAWFKDKVAKNVKDANAGDTKWQKAVDDICENPSDVNNLLKQVEKGGLFGFGVNDNSEVFLNQIMKAGNVAAVSLALAVSDGDIVSTDVRSSPYLLENSMQAAFQSRSEMLKMLLGFYPNTFVRQDLLQLYKKQAPTVLRKEYLSQNINTYNGFLKSRGLKPLFSREDTFSKQVNESISNIEIVENIKQRNEKQKPSTRQLQSVL